MATFEELNALSSQELHDRATKRAQKHLDLKFYWDLLKVLPAAEAAIGNEDQSTRPTSSRSARCCTTSSRPRTATITSKPLRPFYIDYLQKHESLVAAQPVSAAYRSARRSIPRRARRSVRRRDRSKRATSARSATRPTPCTPRCARRRSRPRHGRGPLGQRVELPVTAAVGARRHRELDDLELAGHPEDVDQVVVRPLAPAGRPDAIRSEASSEITRRSISAPM